MELTYNKSGINDMKLLSETRIAALRAANKLDDPIDITNIKIKSYDYYKKSLADGTHTTYLVFDNIRFAGAGRISFFQFLPTSHNPLSDQKSSCKNDSY